MVKSKTKIQRFKSSRVLFMSFLIITILFTFLSTEHLLVGSTRTTSGAHTQSSFAWTVTEVVSTESTGYSHLPSLTVDTFGNVHIAWADYTDYAGAGTDRDIFYKRWNASTSSWTTTDVVSTESTEVCWIPSLAVDSSGNVHIAWNDYTDYAGAGTDIDIFYKRWNASTSSWTTTEVMSTESTAGSYQPSLAIDTLGDVHLAWHDDTDYGGAGDLADIFYKRWNASTSSWTTTEVVSTESTGSSLEPSLAVDPFGNVHMTWYDYTINYAESGIDHDIFYKRWDVSTSSWTTSEVVSTESTTGSVYPSLDVDSLGDVHITWLDWTEYAGSGTDGDIFYKHWDASTSSWSTTEIVSTESTGESAYPSLAVGILGDVHITWFEFTDYAGSGTDTDIFYKRWDASTSSWTTTEIVSTESTSVSVSPSLAVDPLGNMHIAWEDMTDYTGSGGDKDIFYKQAEYYIVIPELESTLNPFYVFLLVSSFTVVSFVLKVKGSRTRRKELT